MKCKEIIESLEQKYAPDFAESWDNVGLLVGDKEKEVHKIFLALDVTDESLVIMRCIQILISSEWQTYQRIF